MNPFDREAGDTDYHPERSEGEDRREDLPIRDTIEQLERLCNEKADMRALLTEIRDALSFANHDSTHKAEAYLFELEERFLPKLDVILVDKC